MNGRSGESADQWRRIAQMHLITGLNERVESSLPPWCVWLYPRIVYTDLNKLWLLGTFDTDGEVGERCGSSLVDR
jgi:hypothetical protein